MKNKKEYLINTVYVLLVLFYLPVLLIIWVAEFGIEKNNKVISTISKIVHKIAKVIVAPGKIFLKLTGKLDSQNNTDENECDIDKNDIFEQIKIDKEFNEFISSECTLEFLIDNIEVTVNVDEKDYSESIVSLYEAYNNAMEVVNEFIYEVSDYIKKYMVKRNVIIKVVSNSEYKKYGRKEDSIGLFSPNYNDDYEYTHAEIVVKLTGDLREDKRTLQHEVGHFLDLMYGNDENTMRTYDYASSNDYMIEYGFKKEAHLIREYATESTAEYIACAYEHKMDGGDMSDIPLTDSILNYMLSKVEVDSERIDAIEESEDNYWFENEDSYEFEGEDGYYYENDYYYEDESNHYFNSDSQLSSMNY